jgi:lysophospholipase L1-like esterase
LLSTSTDLSAAPPPAAQRAVLAHLIRRARNPKVIYELKPGITALYHGALLNVNEHGFRGPAYPHEKPADVLRIVGIGDSLMFGFGVGDDECYLALLERRLNEGSIGKRIQVVNTAVPGYNTVMEVATLSDKGLAFEPDLVLIQLVYNDLELPNFIRTQAPVFSFDRLFLKDFLSRRLRGSDEDAAQGLESQGLQFADRALREAEVPEPYRNLAGWDAFDAAMAELRRLADERSFAVGVIVMAPHRGGRTEEMANRAKKLGFPVLWANAAFHEYLEEEGFKEYLGSPLSLSEDDGHPSALGHSIAADWLARAIVEEGLIEVWSAAGDQSKPSDSRRLL